MKILSIECEHPGVLDVEAIVKNSLESGETGGVAVSASNKAVVLVTDKTLFCTKPCFEALTFILPF